MLTRRMQIQAITDLVAGYSAKDGLTSEQLDSPWREIYQAVLEAEPGQGQQALKRAMSGRPDAETLLGAILGAKPGEWPEYPSLHELSPTLEPIEWLWPSWIPRGMLSLLGAEPGAGKSYVALDLAWRILEGKRFPDGTPAPGGTPNVVYLDAELVPQLINERAKAWQMDCRRLYLMTPKVGEMVDLAQPVWQERLVEMVHTLEPALVVVDSLSSISSKGENNIEDVRGILAFLNALAVDFDCALLLVHHLRKRGMFRDALLTIDDFRGSSHIIAMSRSVLGLSIVQTGPEPDKNGPRRLEIIKTNLARYPKPIGVEFLPLEPTGVILRYGDAPQIYREPSKLDQCVDWLRELLEQGDEMKPKDVIEDAREEGFSRATVYRARKRLRAEIGNTEGRRSPLNAWLMSGSDEAEEE